MLDCDIDRYKYKKEDIWGIFINMDMLELKKFEERHIDEYISFAYDSFQFNNRLFQGPEAEGRESFNAGSKAVIQKFIEAAEEVNRLNKTNILYNSVYHN